MVYDTIIDAISVVGFPIFCAVALGYYGKSYLEKGFIVVENNTKVAQKLVETLQLHDEKVNNALQEIKSKIK